MGLFLSFFFFFFSPHPPPQCKTLKGNVVTTNNAPCIANFICIEATKKANEEVSQLVSFHYTYQRGLGVIIIVK
jgi:hypothetical protein